MIKPEGAVKEMLDNFTKEYGGTGDVWGNVNGDGIGSGVLRIAEDNATAQLMEGVLNTDGYLHIRKDDVLVVRYKGKMNRELADKIVELQDALRKNGAEGIAIDDRIEIIGVIEHGGETRC